MIVVEDFTTNIREVYFPNEFLEFLEESFQNNIYIEYEIDVFTKSYLLQIEDDEEWVTDIDTYYEVQPTIHEFKEKVERLEKKYKMRGIDDDFIENIDN